MSKTDTQSLVILLDKYRIDSHIGNNPILEQYRTAGLLTDYDIEIIEIKGKMSYWERRLAIINEVTNSRG